MICTDVSEFEQRIALRRNKNLGDLQRRRVGMDTGQGSLKVSLNLEFKDDQKDILGKYNFLNNLSNAFSTFF